MMPKDKRGKEPVSNPKKKTPVTKGKRIRGGGPAGKGPNAQPTGRGTTPSGKLKFPFRRIAIDRKGPRNQSGGTGPGKGLPPQPKKK
jgi:hypothetical protein